jgi:hypothetical protein
MTTRWFATPSIRLSSNNDTYKTQCVSYCTHGRGFLFHQFLTKPDVQGTGLVLHHTYIWRMPTRIVHISSPPMPSGTFQYTTQALPAPTSPKQTRAETRLNPCCISSVQQRTDRCGSDDQNSPLGYSSYPGLCWPWKYRALLYNFLLPSKHCDLNGCTCDLSLSDSTRESFQSGNYLYHHQTLGEEGGSGGSSVIMRTDPAGVHLLAYPLQLRQIA